MTAAGSGCIVPQPVLAVTLPPDLTKRLQAIQAILEVGDTDLARASAAKLADHAAEPAIAAILDHLQSHRYAEAREEIDQILSEGTRLVPWEDPEIALLEAEAERIAADLAGVEAEKAELDHLMIRFQAAYHEALGDQIRELLRLRQLMREREAERDPSRQEAFEEARRDSERFERDFDAQKEKARATEWDLSEEEQREMKGLFRQAAKKCHPDAVSPQFRESAVEMFRRLRAAHDSGDLNDVRKLAGEIESGLFETAPEAGEDTERRKKQLRARISALRDALAQARAGMTELTGSSTYARMMENPDWDEYFRAQRERLAGEVARLQLALEDGGDGSPEPVAEPIPLQPEANAVSPATESPRSSRTAPVPKVEPSREAGSTIFTYANYCPNCSKKIQVRPAHWGTMIRCQCGKTFRAMSPEAPTAARTGAGPDTQRAGASRVAQPVGSRTQGKATQPDTPVGRTTSEPDKARGQFRKKAWHEWIPSDPGIFKLLFVVVLVGIAGISSWVSETFFPEPVEPPPPTFAVPEQPLPLSGTTQWSTGLSRVAPFTVHTAGTSHFFIKLVDAASGSDVATVFIRAGATESLRVPTGTYVVKYASGDHWYGYEHLFGPSTRYNKAEETFRFVQDSQGYQGYTVTLYPVVHGNLRTSSIPPSQF